MRVFVSTFVTGVALAGLAQAAVFPEVEPNASKGAANLFTLASGDQITGTTNSAATDPDYFRVRSSVNPGTITLHTLSSNTSLAVLSIRGVNNGFVAGDIDFTASGNGRQTVKWYSVGRSTDNYVRAARLSGSGAQAYTLTMTNTEITPTDAGQVEAGAITLAPNLVGDSEIFLYDSAFNLVAANDNRPGLNLLDAALTSTLANGVYYVAVGSGNTHTSTAFSTTDPTSPFFTGTGTGVPTVQLDAIAAGAIARPENLSRSATDFGLRINGASAILATNGVGSQNGQEVAWFRFEVVPAPSAGVMGVMGAVLVARRRRR